MFNINRLDIQNDSIKTQFTVIDWVKAYRKSPKTRGTQSFEC